MNKIAEKPRHDEGTREGEKILELSPMFHLPAEVLQHIFSMLPFSTIKHLSIVCSQWRHVLSDLSFWRQLFCRRFGYPLMLDLDWRQRCLYTDFTSRLLEAHVPIGDRLMWSARHGYSAYFMRTFHLRDCQPEEALTEALSETIASEGHVELFRSLLASEKVSPFFQF